MTIDTSVLKATDSGLVLDNWEYIIDCCDAVNSDVDSGPSQAIEALKKRLAINNANILLRLILLMLSLAENCGLKMKQEIALTSFTSLLFLMILNKDIHYTIKMRLVEVMTQLSDSFKGDPSLVNISKTLSRVRSEYPDLAGGAPDVPRKTAEVADDDDDLQKALRLSLEEYEGKNGKSEPDTNPFSGSVSGVGATGAGATGAGATGASTTTAPAPPIAVPAADAEPPIVNKVRAIFSHKSSDPEELSFEKGDIITPLELVYKDWWRGSLKGKIGIFPLNYVTPIVQPTKAEMLKDIEVEYNILQQARNIERLIIKLQLLNASENPAEVLDPGNDELVTGLYNQIAPLRPQVARLIGKYAARKEELIELDMRLTEAERTYNGLLNAATERYRAQAQPQGGFYGNQFAPAQGALPQNGPSPHFTGVPGGQNPQFSQQYGNFQGAQAAQGTPPGAPLFGTQAPQYTGAPVPQGVSGAPLSLGSQGGQIALGGQFNGAHVGNNQYSGSQIGTSFTGVPGHNVGNDGQPNAQPSQQSTHPGPQSFNPVPTSTSSLGYQAPGSSQAASAPGSAQANQNVQSGAPHATGPQTTGGPHAGSHAPAGLPHIGGLLISGSLGSQITGPSQISGIGNTHVNEPPAASQATPPYPTGPSVTSPVSSLLDLTPTGLGFGNSAPGKKMPWNSKIPPPPLPGSVSSNPTGPNVLYSATQSTDAENQEKKQTYPRNSAMFLP